MTYELAQQIIADYLSKTMFIKDICSKYNISDYIFNKTLREYNIKKYDPHFLYPQNQRKFRVNEDYFDTESPDMAYILGFLAADCTVRKDKNEIKLTVSDIDKDILNEFYNRIGGRPIKLYTDSKGYNNATWIFTSKHIKEKLAEYNIVPNKTFIFKFPQKLQRKYWLDFIRGYIDGDGSISTAGNSAIRMQLCSASKEVLTTIIDFLYQDYGILKPSILVRNGIHKLYYIQYSTNETRILGDLLYGNSEQLCLKRKRDKFIAIRNKNI